MTEEFAIEIYSEGKGEEEILYSEGVEVDVEI